MRDLTLFRLGAAIAAVFLMSPSGLARASSLEPPGWADGLALAEARDLNPDPKVVEVDLTAIVAPVEIAGTTIRAWTYDGHLPGPLIRAHVGDRLIVHFTNRLPAATTIHWHGVRVPIEMDGVPDISQPEVREGETFTYDFVLRDAGLFWYHPHVMSAAQVGFGLYGALLVEDPADQVHVADQLTLVLSDIGFDSNGVIDSPDSGGPAGMVFGREGDHILANGRVMPTLRVRSGAPERWRIVNAAKSRYFLLDLDGQPFQVIGSDGGLQERPQTVTELLVTPGERVDVIVSPTRSATGSLVLHADLYNRGYGSVEFRNVEDVLTVAFDEEPTMPPAALPNVRRQFEPPLLDGATRVDLVLTLPPLGATNNKPEYQINGAPFWKAQPFHASIGDRQIWTVRNESKFAHPLHLHGFWFLPLDEQLHPIRPMAWKDTINVPVDGTVRFFVTFDERPGMWMFHCHILDHAEGGMMGHVHLEVPPTGADAGHVEGPPTGVDRGSALLGARPLQHELLHAPAGRGLADVQVALAVDAHPVRAQELADLPAAPSEITDDFEIGPPENPHLVIRPVRQVQPLLLRVGRQHGHERRA